jgi:hypothetical protein
VPLDNNSEDEDDDLSMESDGSVDAAAETIATLRNPSASSTHVITPFL